MCFSSLVAMAFHVDVAHAQVRVYRPADPNQVVARLAGEQALLERLRIASAAAPGDANLLTRYVDELIERGQRSGNERLFGHAEQAIANAPPEVRDALAQRHAQLRQQRHDFAGAATILTAALESRPRDTQARLMRSQIYLHLGRAAEAQRDCNVLLTQVDLLTSTTCIAQSRAAQGDVQRAYDLLNAGFAASSAPLADESTRATQSWSAGVKAELAARLGDAQAAGSAYRHAFELDPHSHFARFAYADWLLDGKQFSKARAVAASGQSLGDRLRVVLADQAADTVDARQLLLAWSEARARGDRNYLRDQARFELTVLNDAARAHATALDNFTDHKTPEDALLLAATATAAGDRQAFALLQSWRAATGYRDARLDSLPSSTTPQNDRVASRGK